MKTPRQLLLDRHQTAQARLDEVRRAVLSEMRGRQGTPAGRRTETPWWLAWLVPGRAGFAALGAAWLLILVLHLAGSPRVASGRATSVATTQSPAPWLEQRRLVAELLDLPSATQPPSAATRPRSERRAQPVFLCA